MMRRIDEKDKDLRPDTAEPKNSGSATIRDFAKVFLVPTLLNKAFMVYFGLKFAENPGEGYGYGLIATVLFLLATMGFFLYRYWGIEDP